VERGVSVVQTLYTSRRRLTGDPPRDDRPYAAHLGAALSLHVADDGSLGMAELSLGVVGPGALGEQAQDLAHDRSASRSRSATARERC
jgi:lipid A 3-O-deacylase